MKNYITCGLDEAGRGALAGPLVGAAVALTTATTKTITNNPNATIRDSKTLSKKQREKMYELITSLKIPFAVANISVQHINERGIGWANIEIFKELLGKITADTYIIDGRFNLKKFEIKTKNACPEQRRRIRCQVDADATEVPVILAGIIAKVTRDSMMNELHIQHPVYQWDTNAGYGTRAHIESIRSNTFCIQHRTQFVTAALKNYAQKVGSAC